MTLEKRIVFSPEDIRGIRLTCKECGHGIDCDFGQKGRTIPTQCPWCGCEWDGAYDPVRRERWEQLKLLQRLALQGDKGGHDKLKISFEIDGKGYTHEAK